MNATITYGNGEQIDISGAADERMVVALAVAYSEKIGSFIKEITIRGF